MARKAGGKSDVIVPGGVDEYIENCPKEVQGRLNDMRLAIQSAAPGATETVSYFQMPGYFYVGYDYNGMFAWFSFKPPYVRLHVRPPVLEDHKKDLGGFATTKAIISFPADKAIPKTLVKNLVKASVRVMKQK
ncbi:iron chaperone [Rhodanobacter sp. Col0626]|uniref:iron chaperone n=1 Tax=Rhodanobacter sp. Col0626 TaxID=3415679 RepID=UPI003CEE2857